MTAAPRSVAIIHHQRTPRTARDAYLVSHLARLWRERLDITAHHLTGTSDLVPADLAFVHVDLSVVPSAYARLARRFPRALNVAVRDIRKRRFSELVVKRPSTHRGAVIVKTNLNGGGSPERWLASRVPRLTRRGLRQLWRILGWSPRIERITSAHRYEIYPSADGVPLGIYLDPRFIVERFVPERLGRWYCHRRYYFLGTAEVNQLWLGSKPICAGDVAGVSDDAVIDGVAVPPELRAFRRRFALDYGKIDYVFGDDGRAIVLDVNKTPWGTCRDPAHQIWLDRLCDDLHSGILQRSEALSKGAPVLRANHG